MGKSVGGLKRTGIGVYFSKDNKIKGIDIDGEVSLDEMIEHLEKLKVRTDLGGK